MTEGVQVRLWGWGTMWYVVLLIFCAAAWYGAWMVVGKAAFGQELQSGVPYCDEPHSDIYYRNSAGDIVRLGIPEKFCGDSSLPLQQAYAYCRQYFWKLDDIIASNDLSRCVESKPGVGGYTWIDCTKVGHYTLPACDEVVKRWGVSSQKKAADEAAEKARPAEIAHAKTFVEAVRKGLK